MEPETAGEALGRAFPWDKALENLISWIHSQTSSVMVFTVNQRTKHTVHSTLTVVSSFKTPNLIQHASERALVSSSELDSDDEDEDEDELDTVGLARALAQHRSPRDARIWSKKRFSLQSVPGVDNAPTSAQPHTTKKATTENGNRQESPLFIHSDEEQESEPEDEVEEKPKGDNAYADFLRLSQPKVVSDASRRVLKGQTSAKVRRSLHGGTTQPFYAAAERLGPHEIPIRKRSLLDPQPDAQKISFDSQSPAPARTPPKRKRDRTPSPTTDEGNDFFEPFEPSIDEVRKKRGRISSAAPRSGLSAPPLDQGIDDEEDPTQRILDRIHGKTRSDPYPTATPVRKGRGYEWTQEQEEFLIDQIEQYGPAWSDIARIYCKPGMIFHGRDQIKLKDKARNIKEKYIRYAPSTHFVF